MPGKKPNLLVCSKAFSSSPAASGPRHEVYIHNGSMGAVRDNAQDGTHARLLPITGVKCMDFFPLLEQFAAQHPELEIAVEKKRGTYLLVTIPAHKAALLEGRDLQQWVMDATAEIARHVPPQAPSRV